MQSVRPERVAAYFRTGLPPTPYRPGIGPWGIGPFVRWSGTTREAVVGQWALIADNAKEAKSSARIMTNNARSESIATKPTFRGPLGAQPALPDPGRLLPRTQLGERQEPVVALPQNRRRPLGPCRPLERVDRTLPAVRSCRATMLTVNADAHPLMKRMHKPDPRLGPTEQDKRSVVVIEPTDFDRWLTAPTEEARALIRLAPVGVFDAAPDRQPDAPTTTAASAPHP